MPTFLKLDEETLQIKNQPLAWKWNLIKLLEHKSTLILWGNFGTERARLAQSGFRVNFIKEIPFNEISENLKFVLKNVRGDEMAWHSTCKTSLFLAWNPFKNENLNFCENLAGNPK